jgi:hypothetical protein
VITYTGKNPQGNGWADEGGSNYTEDDPKLQKAISSGWNHGLVGGSGGVVPFDGDDADRRSPPPSRWRAVLATATTIS